MRLAIFRLRRKMALSFAYGKTHASNFRKLSRNLSGNIATTEEGSYPAISPLLDRLTTKTYKQCYLHNSNFFMRFSGQAVRRYIFCCAVCPFSEKTPEIVPGVTRHHALRSPDFPPGALILLRRPAAAGFIAYSFLIINVYFFFIFLVFFILVFFNIVKIGK